MSKESTVSLELPYINHKFDPDIGGWEIGRIYAFSTPVYDFMGILEIVTSKELFFKDVFFQKAGVLIEEILNGTYEGSKESRRNQAVIRRMAVGRFNSFIFSRIEE